MIALGMRYGTPDIGSALDELRAGGCDRIMVLFEGRNAAERLIGETNIEEIVNLIVGRKFQSVSTGPRPAAGASA